MTEGYDELQIIALTHAEIADSTRSPIVERTLLHTPAAGRSQETFSLTSTRANGCSGPGLHITWVQHGGFQMGDLVVPVSFVARVEMFRDTWLAFTELRDVFDLLATFDSHIRPEETSADELKTALLAIGFVESVYSREAES